MLIAIVNGPDGEQVSEFEDQSIVLGRHGTFRLNDRKVSKQHARLQSDGSAWYVEDMGSKNGTFVNGVRVVRPCRVKEGDRLRLGQTQVVLSKLSHPDQLHAPRMKFTEPPPAPASVAPPPAPPAQTDAKAESGFLTLSAGDLLESAEFPSAQLDLEVPSLDLQEPTAPPVTADAATDNVSPVGEAAPVADVAHVEDVLPTADFVPAEEVTCADDVASVEDLIAPVASVEDVSAVDMAAPLDDAPPTEITAASAPIEDAATVETSVGAAPESEAITVQDLPEATAAREADVIAVALNPAPLEAAIAPDAGADAEERRAEEFPADDLPPATDAVDATTEDDAQPSWAVELPPVATPAADVAEPAAAAFAAAAEETSQPVAEEQSRDLLDEKSSPEAPATEAPVGRGISKPDDMPATASDDDESLAAFMNVLPHRRTGKSLTRFDEAILSIRPLALREELAALQPPPVSPWRRSVPYAMLSLVLLAVIANLALLVMFRRDASRDAAALQESLKKQQQLSAELVLQEVREELRAPVAQNAQAIQALGDSVLAKQEALAEKLQAQLAAATTAAAKPPAAAAPDDEQSRRAAEESRAALMRELNEIKTALADMRKATAPAPAVATAPPPAAAPGNGKASDAAPSVAARGDDSNAESRTPAGEASAAPAAALIAPRKGYAQSFVIDASGALQNSIPEAVAEVRRAIETARSRGNVRILLLYQGRLIELPPAALTTPGTAEPIDRGEADLAAAVKTAMKDRPSVLNLLSDTLGGGGDAVSAVLRQADMSGTSVNVTQFFARNGRDQLKSLAREYHGTYGYVPPRGQ